MEPINERFAPAEGYTTHEALKAIFRHYADRGRKPRAGVERGVDRTQWAKLVSESPDLPARLATADADICIGVFRHGAPGEEASAKRDWIYLGKYRGHYKPVTGLQFGEGARSPRLSLPRLATPPHATPCPPTPPRGGIASYV